MKLTLACAELTAGGSRGEGGDLGNVVLPTRTSVRVRGHRHDMTLHREHKKNRPPPPLP